MSLEDQVVSPELSKRLKELKVKQKSLFYWIVSFNTNYHISYTEGDGRLLPQERNDFYSAFTVAELGEGLPEEVIFNGILGGKRLTDFYDGNEADARAKMLIYLIENKLVKI